MITTAALLSFAPALADPLVLAVSEEVYDVGDVVEIQMSGGPDAGLFFWLMDLEPGPLDLPGLPTLDVGGTGVLQVLPLPPLAGGFDFTCGPLDCDFPLLNTTIHMQLVAVAKGGEVSVSNPDTLTVSDGGKCALSGCTPGYWKNHLDAWAPTGYAPGDDYDTVFGVDLFEPDITLLDALQPPAHLEPIEMHSVAALLNASHPEGTYPYAAHVVIGLVREAWLTGDSKAIEDVKDMLDLFNNEGCTL